MTEVIPAEAIIFTAGLAFVFLTVFVLSRKKAPSEEEDDALHRESCGALFARDVIMNTGKETKVSWPLGEVRVYDTKVVVSTWSTNVIRMEDIDDVHLMAQIFGGCCVIYRKGTKSDVRIDTVDAQKIRRLIKKRIE